MNKIFKYGLILILVGVISSVGVALVYVVTAKPIAENKKKDLDVALKVVLGADPVEVPSAGETPIWTTEDKSAYASIGEAQGYSSKLKVLVAVSGDLKTIKAVRVLEQQETPGLGTRVNEKTADKTLFEKIRGFFGGDGQPEKAPSQFSAFEEQYAGKPVPTNLNEARKMVDVMTAATITSNATSKAVFNAADVIRKSVEDAAGND